MNPENNPGAGREAQQPRLEVDSKPDRQANPQPSFRLATEGASFDNQNLETNILNASTGTSDVGRVPGIPGSSPTPERQPQQSGSHKGRNILLASSAAVLGTAAVVGGALGFMKMNSGGSNSGEGVSGVATETSAAGTPTPNGTTETPSATATETVTPTPTSTETPTPTEAPVLEGSKGNVASIEALNIPEAQKEAINKMLENSEVQIIVEKDGQVVVVAIENEMIEAAKNGNRTCPANIGSTVMEPCRAVSEIRLSDGMNPDSEQRLIDGAIEGKYQAFMNKNGVNITKDQYLNDGSDNSYLMRAQDVFSGVTDKYPVGQSSPLVYIVKNKPDDITFTASANFGMKPRYGNGVLGIESYSLYGGVGKVETYQGMQITIPELQLGLGADLSTMSDKGDLSINGDGFYAMQGRPYPLSTVEAIHAHFRQFDENNKEVLSEFPGIFRVKGIIPPGSK